MPIDDNLRRNIIERWMRHAPARWWGDPMDVRFLLAERLNALSGRRVLDVGCNAGVLAAVAAEAGNDVFGIELERDALLSLRRLSRAERLALRAVCGNWRELPFAPRSFDTLVLGWVLYYERTVEEKIRTVGRLSELLKPGGEMHFVEANRVCPVQGRGKDCFWTPREAAAFFENHGYSVRELVGWNPLPSLLCWLPGEVKLMLPRALILSLYPPGRLVQFLPGWYDMFKRLGTQKWLLNGCRSYYLRAVKRDD